MAGRNIGTVVTDRMRKIARAGKEVWRRTRAGGHETDFELAPNGVSKIMLTDPKDKLSFTYDPGEPELVTGINPGETRSISYAVRVSPLDAPTTIKDRGDLTAAFTYLGKYRIASGAGNVVAHGFRKVLSGKVGPSKIKTRLYVFYAEGIGEVARVSYTDVTVLLVYHHKDTEAYVLREPPDFYD